MRPDSPAYEDAVGTRALLDWSFTRRIPRGLSTGHQYLDLCVEGLETGEFVAVAGSPGAGVSVFLLGLLRQAIDRAMPTTFITCDDPLVWVMPRLLASVSRQSMRWVEHYADLDRDARRRFDRARDLLLAAPIQFIQRDHFERRDLVGWVHKEDHSLVIIDRVTPLGIGWLEVAVRTRNSRALVVTGTREESEWPWAPREVAEVADRIFRVERPDRLGITERGAEADLHLVLNRHGPTTAVPVAFLGHQSRFVDISPYS